MATLVFSCPLAAPVQVQLQSNELGVPANFTRVGHVAPATRGDDYERLNATIQIPAGTVSHQVRIRTLRDDLEETGKPGKPNSEGFRIAIVGVIPYIAAIPDTPRAIAFAEIKDLYYEFELTDGMGNVAPPAPYQQLPEGGNKTVHVRVKGLGSDLPPVDYEARLRWSALTVTMPFERGGACFAEHNCDTSHVWAMNYPLGDRETMDEESGTAVFASRACTQEDFWAFAPRCAFPGMEQFLSVRLHALEDSAKENDELARLYIMQPGASSSSPSTLVIDFRIVDDD